jgi:hypothetical protein
MAVVGVIKKIVFFAQVHIQIQTLDLYRECSNQKTPRKEISFHGVFFVSE